MDEDRKQQIATFRFGVIHDLVGHMVLEPGEQARLIREKCSRKWDIPYSDKTRMSRVPDVNYFCALTTIIFVQVGTVPVWWDSNPTTITPLWWWWGRSPCRPGRCPYGNWSR